MVFGSGRNSLKTGVRVVGFFSYASQGTSRTGQVRVALAVALSCLACPMRASFHFSPTPLSGQIEWDILGR
jgi:hypothetical protein